MWRNSDFPPGFEGHPLLYLVTLFSMMLTVLLGLEWLWRVCWAFFERPFPVKHPSTVLRLIFMLVLIGMLCRIGPDALLLMRWPVLSVHGRMEIQRLDAIMDSTSFVWMSLAWLVGRLGDPFLQIQLEKKPIPVHLWPTMRQLRRPAYIGMGVFAIAFALTYMR